MEENINYQKEIEEQKIKEEVMRIAQEAMKHYEKALIAMKESENLGVDYD